MTKPSSRPPKSLQQRLEEQATAPASTQSLTMCTYNIQDARNSRLEFALRNLSVQNIDLAILTELRIPESKPIHTRSSQGYTVYATYTTRTNQGGIGLVYRQERIGWCIESIKRHGPNILSFHLILGNTVQPVIGAYLPPSTLDDLPFLTEALDRFPVSKQPPLLLGDLNVDLSNKRATDPRTTQVSEILATYGLMDMLPHFKQRKPYRDLCTWTQTRNDHILRSRCDYILGTDRRLFKTVSIRDPRHFSTDHFMVVATFLERPSRSAHKLYLQGRRQFPLRVPKWGPKNYVDTLFQQILSNIDPRNPQRSSKRPTWLSPSTLRLIDQRCSFWRDPHHDRTTA